MPKLPFDRRADLAGLEREGGIGDGGIDDVGLRHHAEIGVGLLQAAFLDEIGKARALDDAVVRGGGVFRVREYHLAQFAALGRAVIAFVLVVISLGVGVGDRVRLGEIGRRQREQRHLAVFGRAEHDLAFLEIFAELFGRRLRNIAGLGWAQARYSMARFSF